ncbi:hypothetical protein COU75_03265 [Candidatus Peregrinibacteria bacterium CG10_big_fil_rev_8_21_14_0_10_42_8]|nr:MAG: hypothetical protein COU75_03265 [Candidatus Peregrinibacteria bacterium CG10_big_fil_rev_8_21_14_0_10_42_8]
MFQFLLIAIALELAASPMPARAFTPEDIALDISLADCEALNALTPEKKQTFFSMTHFMQISGALSFVIGPQCSYLGEVQAIAIIDDPALTIEPTKEILYFIPSIHTLFVPHNKNNAIAYAMKISGDVEPLEYFMQNKKNIASLAEVAKDFAAYAKDIRNPVAVSSSQSSASTTAIVQNPVRRPITSKAASSSLMIPAAPVFASSSSLNSLITNPVNEKTTETPLTELPEITQVSEQSMFSHSGSVSVWQVVIGIGVVALLIYIYLRKRTRDLISQG